MYSLELGRAGNTSSIISPLLLTPGLFPPAPAQPGVPSRGGRALTGRPAGDVTRGPSRWQRWP